MPKISVALRRKIQQARAAKHWTQEGDDNTRFFFFHCVYKKQKKKIDLAKACNLKTTIIKDYESGKAVPSPAILNKIGRQLGVGLSIND